jgi:hypothetical protein
MTQMNKFKGLNGQFASLGIEMAQRYKFRDRWWTLLKKLFRVTKFSDISGCSKINIISSTIQILLMDAIFNH